MASQFVRKITDTTTSEPIKETTTSGDLIITKDDKVLINLNGTLKDLTAPEDAPSNDMQLVHKTGNETISGDKTFTGNNTFTNQINGSLSTRPATFTDYADVANDMTKYSGNWYVQDHAIKNDPVGANGGLAWYLVQVIPAYGTNTGYIQITIVDGKIFSTGIDAGEIKGWHLMPHDSDIVHNTGNESIAGNKTLVGNTSLSTTTILSGKYGLRVTSSGIQKTTDGKTWVSANI